MGEKLTLKEMAAHLKFTDKTFKKYVLELKIPHIGLGRRMRFDAEKVEKFLESLVETPGKIELPKIKVKRELDIKGQNPNKARYERMLG